MYDAVGRAMIAASMLEFWFNHLASGLTGREYAEISWMKREQVKKLVSSEARSLTPDDRAALEAVVEKTWELTGTRDAIVHGSMGTTDDTGQVLYCWRAPTRDAEIVVDPRWPNRPFPEARVQTFTRPDLIEFARECRATYGHIQANSGRWNDQASRARGGV
jgi:hypothetical protein